MAFSPTAVQPCYPASCSPASLTASAKLTRQGSAGRHRARPASVLTHALYIRKPPLRLLLFLPMMHNDSQIPRLRRVALRPLTRSTFDVPVASVPCTSTLTCMFLSQQPVPAAQG